MKLTKTEMARLIDHTQLKTGATPVDIKNLCAQAKEFGFGAVCVNSCYAEMASKEMEGFDTKVCIVAGFPLGANDPAVKAWEAAVAVRAGAQEIDVVINTGFLKGGLFKLVRADLEGVVAAARGERPDVIIKVILETFLLSESEKIEACRLAVAAGADFVKTSTGFVKGGATVTDVALLRRTVGPDVGVKASGGIRDLVTALAMLKAGANRLGTSSGIAIIKELEE